MRKGRLAIAGVLAVLAVLAVLFAQDLRSWQTTLDTAQTVYAARSFAARDGEKLSTSPRTLLPSSLSAELLSVRLDQQWLRAVPRFLAVYDLINPLDALGPGAYRVLSGPEHDLTTVTNDPDPVRASQAYDLLAVLYFRSAYPGTGTNPSLLGEAVSDLQNAVRADPANEIAKQNLELAARVLVAKHGGHLKQQGAGTHASPRRRGAPPPPPGGGF